MNKPDDHTDWLTELLALDAQAHHAAGTPEFVARVMRQIETLPAHRPLPRKARIKKTATDLWKISASTWIMTPLRGTVAFALALVLPDALDSLMRWMEHPLEFRRLLDHAVLLSAVSVGALLFLALDETLSPTSNGF